MNIELDQDEVAIIRELLESRISEIHPEIRRCRDYKYGDALKRKLKSLEQLLAKFADQAEPGQEQRN